MADRTTSKPRKPRGRPIPPRRARAVAAKPERTYASYKELNWAQIRDDFETTSVSWGELARRYGIRSDTTIRKRAAQEGWRKNVDAIAANITRAALAAQAGDALTPLFRPSDAGPVIDADPLPAMPPPPQLTVEQFAAAVAPVIAEIKAEQAKDGRSAAPRTPTRKSRKTKAKQGDDEHASQSAETPPPRPAEAVGEAEAPPRSAGAGHDDAAVEPLREVPLRDEVDAATVATAEGLARLHISAVAEHLNHADRLSLVANLVLARVLVAVGGGVDDGAATGEARGALMFLNPERETLAGLLKACGDLMERSQVMKRRALGMDPRHAGNLPQTPGPQAGAAVRRVESDVAQLARTLPTGVLSILRDAGAALARLPPAQRGAMAAASAAAQQEEAP